MKLDPEVLDQTISKWIENDLQLEIVESEATEMEFFSIDGMTLRRTLR